MDQTRDPEFREGEGGQESGGLTPTDLREAILTEIAPLGGYLAENVSAITAGSVFKSFLSASRFEAIKALDSIHPTKVEGLRRPTSATNAIENRTGASTFAPPAGCVRLLNQGGSTFDRIPHVWLKSPISNLSSGPYRAKALLAMEAEGQSFDTSFYRMDRRDSDKLYGYLTSFITRCADNELYGSFLKEALSASLFTHAVRRSTLSRSYATGLTTSYQVGDQEDRSTTPPTVTAHPDFGLLRSEAHGVPSNEAKISFIPCDRIMEEGVLCDKFDSAEVFVSKARTQREIASDIIAAYVGSRSEYGIFGTEVVMVLATLNKSDFVRILEGWGMRPHQDGDLSTIAHYLWLKGYNVTDATFTTTEADVLRVREFFARNCVEYEDEEGDYRRVTDFGQGTTMTLPYSDWRFRLAVVYKVLAFDGDSCTHPVRQYREMRWEYYYRAILLGEMLDHASQIVCGSRRNTEHARVRSLKEPLSLIETLVTNLVYVDGAEKALGFGMELFGSEASDPDEFEMIVETPLTFESDPEPLTWYVETRMTWNAVYSPDLGSFVEAILGSHRDSKISWYGPSIMMKETDVGYKNLCLSLMRDDRGATYEFRAPDAKHRRSKIRWTNPGLPSHFVVWSEAYDIIIGDHWTPEVEYSLIKDDIIVPYGLKARSGGYAGHGQLAGFF